MAKMTISEADRELRVVVPTAECPVETVKFTAYLCMDRADPLLEPAPGGVRVRLRWREAISRERLREEGRAFVEELRRQRFQGEVLAQNRPIVEFIVRQALAGPAQPSSAEARSELDLTPEEERELDRLIAEVEAQIAEDTAAKAKDKAAKGEDPLQIKTTWEDSHGAS